MSVAVSHVRRRTGIVPEVAVVAGSGLAGLGSRVSEAVVMPYREVPGWPTPTVRGHPGELVLGYLAGRQAAVARGRVHMYEGWLPRQVTFAVRVLMGLGARLLVITNAAGALDPDLKPGHVMVMADHIFLPGMAGLSPLVGPAGSAGPRFPVMTDAYDAGLRALALRHLGGAGLIAKEGTYAMVVGPSFETPAEARMLRRWGADAVGMSTVPEVIAARQAGARVLGLSVITNNVPVVEAPPADAGDAPASLHREVEAVAGAVAPQLEAALEAVVADAL